ncbi:MAG: hypothetical protein WA157_06970 [Rhodoferax ferrireducens]
MLQQKAGLANAEFVVNHLSDPDRNTGSGQRRIHGQEVGLCFGDARGNGNIQSSMRGRGQQSNSRTTHQGQTGHQVLFHFQIQSNNSAKSHPMRKTHPMTPTREAISWALLSGGNLIAAGTNKLGTIAQNVSFFHGTRPTTTALKKRVTVRIIRVQFTRIIPIVIVMPHHELRALRATIGEHGNIIGPRVFHQGHELVRITRPATTTRTSRHFFLLQNRVIVRRAKTIKVNQNRLIVIVAVIPNQLHRCLYIEHHTPASLTQRRHPHRFATIQGRTQKTKRGLRLNEEAHG